MARIIRKTSAAPILPANRPVAIEGIGPTSVGPPDAILWTGDRFQDRVGRPFFAVGGIYANFLWADVLDVPLDDLTLSAMSPFGGRPIVEFQDATDDQLRRWLAFCRAEGFNFLRLFCRGAMRPCQDPLDVGGRVNPPLLRQILRYLDLCLDAGIRIHFVAVPEPRESVYMNPRTLRERALPLMGAAGCLRPHQRRILDPDRPRLSINQFFTDPDVMQCHLDYIDDLAAKLGPHPALLALEVYNEQQWGDVFFWQAQADELNWTRRIAERLKLRFPHLPVCCSHAGFGLAGHDPLIWQDAVAMDFYSPHAYQALCGQSARADFASIVDLIQKYSLMAGPTMFGECDPGRFSGFDKPRQLAVRDMVWFSMLNGCPGFGMWMAGGEGELAAAREVYEQHRLDQLVPADPLIVDARWAVDALHQLERNPSPQCALDENTWCPHREQGDSDHIYCHKLTSGALRQLIDFNFHALRHGIDYRFTRDAAEAVSAWPLERTSVRSVGEIPRRFIPSAHCHLKQMSAADDSVHVVYLRTYRRFAVDSLTGRLPTDPLPTAVGAHLPGHRYCVTIMDLDARSTRSTTISGNEAIDLGVTNHDFALIIRR